MLGLVARKNLTLDSERNDNLPNQAENDCNAILDQLSNDLGFVVISDCTRLAKMSDDECSSTASYDTLPTLPPSVVYVMPDIKRNGNSMANSSILSFSVVAVDQYGRLVTEFHAVLEERPDCPGDDSTHKWWLQFPEQYARATLDPRPIDEVMCDFVNWVQSLEKHQKTIWCAGPVSADWPWLKLYVDLYTPDDFSLGHKCRCLSTLEKSFMAMYGIGKTEMEAQKHRWCMDIDGDPHDPRYDAYTQTRVFVKMTETMGAKF